MGWKKELTLIVQCQSGVSKLRFDEPLSKHTYFGIGGPAAAYVEVNSIGELAAVAQLKRRWNVPVAIIGRGSNLLVSDAGYTGIVVRLIGVFDQLEFDGNHVHVGAGVSLPRLSKTAARHGLSGVEFALGIPGSVGGALIMNAGAWGSSFGDVVEHVEVMTDEGKLIRLGHDDAGFGYRHSGLNAYFCATSALLQLTSGDVKTITDCMNTLYQKKIASQPFAEENSGCMFKNPPDNSAGKLIDECGLKGYRIGGAKVSEIHANFILNLDNATAQDVLELVCHIQTCVKQDKGVDLEMEVKLLGFEYGTNSEYRTIIA
ncbi:MAG: UDP-N-acetylmuramate dehydrogenase [Candidatus Poribacteria bacterium]|nr:UDP-N-acetylmuramate dehydrogenase [Candidatus Poribacteria bacterium]